MAVKMGYEKDKHACCLSCNNTIAKSKEMYKIGVGTENSNLLCINLCDKCSDELSTKLLRAQCNFNARLKSQEEIRKFGRIDEIRRGGK